VTDTRVEEASRREEEHYSAAAAISNASLGSWSWSAGHRSVASPACVIINLKCANPGLVLRPTPTYRDVYRPTDDLIRRRFVEDRPRPDPTRPDLDRSLSPGHKPSVVTRTASVW